VETNERNKLNQCTPVLVAGKQQGRDVRGIGRINYNGEDDLNQKFASTFSFADNSYHNGAGTQLNDDGGSKQQATRIRMNYWKLFRFR
jgi:hypothetical protein